jgi:hypothetical protein
VSGYPHSPAHPVRFHAWNTAGRAARALGDALHAAADAARLALYGLSGDFDGRADSHHSPAAERPAHADWTPAQWCEARRRFGLPGSDQ